MREGVDDIPVVPADCDYRCAGLCPDLKVFDCPTGNSFGNKKRMYCNTKIGKCRERDLDTFLVRLDDRTGENVAQSCASTGVISAALGVWQPFWRVYIWIIPVFVKKIATVSPFSVSNSYFVPTPGRLSERRDIEDIREMILKYIMLCDRMHRRISSSGKNKKKSGLFLVF